LKANIVFFVCIYIANHESRRCEAKEMLSMKFRRTRENISFYWHFLCRAYQSWRKGNF